MPIQLISVDLQNDFTSSGGKHHALRPSVTFDQQILFPFLKEHNIKISEIISDYRQPRPGDSGEGCVPGTWGYESIVPKELVKAQWIKCMNSPLWTRENAGDPTKEPGLPFQAPKEFGEWLRVNVGEPGKVQPVVFGLTIDCCVLSTLQELSWRGFYPQVLKEAVDQYDGSQEDKEAIFKVASNWANVVTWDELKKRLA